MGEFITPPTLPPTTYCRRLLIPNSPEWIGTVTGALMSLIYASEWKQTTGITAEQAAERAREMFDLYLDSGNDGECGDMACCNQVTLHRINGDSGRPEISTDGGTTWQPDPADIQYSIPLYPPPVGEGSDTSRCDAATNASEHVNELIDATGENLSTAATVFELAVAVAEAVLGLFLIIVSAGALTGPVTAVATAIWAAATGVFNLGIAAYNAYWTVDKKDAILCALYCHISPDGQFTEAGYQAFRTEVKSTLPASPALDIVMTALNAGGARGLSQMASYGNAALSDCGSCPCATCVDRFDIYDLGGGVGGGTIVDFGDNWVTVASQAFGARNVLCISTGDANKCCSLVSYEVVEGTYTDYIDGVACGQNPVVGNIQFNINITQEWNTFAAFHDGGSPFTIKFTFAE